MSNNTNLVRIGGWSGIALILLFALAVFLLPGTAAGGWLSILGSLLIVPFFIGVYFILRDSGNEVLVPFSLRPLWLAFKKRATLDSHCRAHHHRVGLRMVDALADPD